MLALYSNLQRLLVIRCIVFVSQLLALFYVQWVLGFELPWKQVWGILALFGIVNYLLYWRLRSNRPVTEAEFLGHLLVDVIAFSLLLYFTGGANNPFVSYLLVPIMISAATLSGAFTWGLAAISLAAYTLLLFWYVPLPALVPEQVNEHAMHMGDTLEAGGFSLHIIGMWVNFLVSAGLITWFVVRMAAELRSQQSQLARLRETTLRDEQIMAIATQAAGTAHELGTPLSTMAVMLKDMQLDADTVDSKRQIEILQKQVALCSQSLRGLVSATDPQLGTQLTTLKQFVDQILDHWQLLKPEVSVQVNRSAQESGVQLESVDGLQQALINLLNNAAEAGGGELFINSEVEGSHWLFDITDKGPGITDEMKNRLGLEIVSTKQRGLGVGFMLSHATLERLGGSVRLENAPSAGTLTHIRLPVRLAS